MSTTGERIRAAREGRGWTQAVLAEKLNITIGTLSGYERNYRQPNLQMLQKIASVLGVTSDYLLCLTDDPHGTHVPEVSDPDPNAAAIAKITAALQADPELLEFWQEISRRDDLFLMFKQVRDLSPESIRKIIRVIKAIEDEEAE